MSADESWPDAGRAGSMACIVRGSDAVNRAAHDLIVRATVSIIRLERQPFVRASRPRSLPDAVVEAVRRGVDVRTLDASDSLPMRMLVADGSAALVPIASEGPWVSAALVVNDSDLGESLSRIFDELWEQACRESEQPEYSPDEIVLLRLLAHGLTDAAISRQVGSSPRTIGRRLSILQRKMGVVSRFEMGVRAQRGGIL